MICGGTIAVCYAKYLSRENELLKTEVPLTFERMNGAFRICIIPK